MQERPMLKKETIPAVKRSFSQMNSDEEIENDKINDILGMNIEHGGNFQNKRKHK